MGRISEPAGGSATAGRLPRRVAARAAFAFAAAAAAGSAAQAQDPPEIPSVISPLRVETDHNGVNLVTGQTQIPVPVLSAPGASNLRYDRIQNLAPYVSGTINAAGGDYSTASFSVHTGSGTEAFRCVDTDCVSVTGTGSGFVQNVRAYRQAGTGTQWTFTERHSDSGITSNPRRLKYYSLSATYQNGEVISYAYDEADHNGLTYYRPRRISSNLGYSITVTYQVPLEQGPTTPGWGSPSVVSLWGPGSQLIGRLTYGGGTITDLGGREYSCTGCSSSLGSDLETTAGSTQLPTEGSPNLQVTQLSSTQRVVGSVTRDGVVWNYAYTNLRYDPDSRTYWYDALTVTGPDGFSQTHSFTLVDRRNVLTSIRDPIGRPTSFLHANFRPIRITYPEGNRIDVVYDDFGNIVSRTATPKANSGLTAVTETAFYPTDDSTMCSTRFISDVRCYRPLWSRDGLGRQTDYVYNERGQLTRQDDPADANGVRRRTIVEYETTMTASGTPLISRRRVVRVCGVGTTCGTTGEIRTEYSYSRDNTFQPSLVRQVDPASGAALETSYAYDAAGRVTMEDGPLPGTADARFFRYDVHGRRTHEIGPFGASGTRIAQRHAYRPADDRVTRTSTGTMPDENGTLTVRHYVDYLYDPRRNRVRETLRSGSTRYALLQRRFDLSNRLECEARRMNPAAFASPPDDACVLGPRGTGAEDFGPDRIVHNLWDAAGQLIQVKRAYGTPLQQNYATYSYTANGQRRTVTDANGNRAELRYDGFDRLSRWVFPSRTAPGAVNEADFESYTYDPVGNRLSLRKRDGSLLQYRYDGLNRMTRKTVPERAGLDPVHTRDVFYAYDIRGLQTEARFDSLAGEGVSNAYDAFGRLVSSRFAMGGATRTLGHQYDEAGRRTQLTYPGGQAMTYAYDAASRLTGLYEGTGTSNPRATWTYNVRGLPTARGEGAGSSASWTWDPVERLASQGHAFTSGDGNVSSTFAYNPAAQIVTRTRSNDAYAADPPDVDQAYAVNGLNQYTAVAGTPFAYDANGNLASDGSRTYTYDVENRLVGSSGGVTLTYDPLGRLWQVAGPSDTTRLLWDGDMLLAEYGADNAFRRRYTHGSAAGDDPLLWAEAGGTTRWLHADHQGSIVAIAGAGGGTYRINAYDAWGLPDPGHEGRFGFTGQIWLPELGLYHYKARVYSPTLGRFLQTDPIGYDDQINLYAYVGNDPLNRADPTGMTCTQVGTQPGGAAQYSCRIDKVAILDRRNRVVDTREPTARENRRFAAFNRQYTNAVNRLVRNPDRTVRVAAVHDGAGSFETTAGKAAAALISRQFLYAARGPSGVSMGTAGGPGVDGLDARTYVHSRGLREGQAGIVHDGGLHGTPEEDDGGLQRPDYPLNRIDHRRQYQEAACVLLGGIDCD